MKDLILDDSFKIASLFASFLSKIDNFIEIIIFRNFTYNQVKVKLSKLASKDHVKDEEDKAFATHTVKGKGKKVNRKKGYTWYKKHFSKSNYTTHNWTEYFKLKEYNEEKGEKSASRVSLNQQESAKLATEVPVVQKNNEPVYLSSLSYSPTPQ